MILSEAWAVSRAIAALYLKRHTTNSSGKAIQPTNHSKAAGAKRMYLGTSGLRNGGSTNPSSRNYFVSPLPAIACIVGWWSSAKNPHCSGHVLAAPIAPASFPAPILTGVSSLLQYHGKIVGLMAFSDRNVHSRPHSDGAGESMAYINPSVKRALMQDVFS